MFEKYSGRKFDPNKDTILNTVYQSAQTNKMMGGEGMNEIVDGEEGNGSPKTAEEAIQAMMVEKSMENPILRERLWSSLNSQLGNKENESTSHHPRIHHHVDR